MWFILAVGLRLRLLVFVQAVLLGLGFSTGFAQRSASISGWPPLQVIDAEQGLPQAFVSGVIEDVQGFIWISTLGGLARYDGQKIIPFPHRSDDPTSPSAGPIYLMKKAEHRFGQTVTAWLLFESGAVDLLNTNTGQCQMVPTLSKALQHEERPHYLYVDHQGNLWGVFKQRGAFYYNRQHQQFTRLRRINGLCSDTINAITEDKRGRVCVITPSGISYLGTDGRLIASNRFQQTVPVLQQMGSQANKGSVLTRPNGEIMLNNRTHLLFIDPQIGSIRSVVFAQQPTSDQPLLEQRADNTAYLVAGGRLYHYSEQQGLTLLWQYKPPEGAPFKELFGTALCIDRSGVLWLGANTKGLFRLDLAAMPLHAYSYRTTFCADALETTIGIPIQSYFHWPFADPTRPSSYVFRSDYDRQGRLWMGIGYEVGYAALPNKSITLLPKLPRSAAIESEEFLRGLSIDPGGQVWIVSKTATSYRYNQKTHQWEAPFGEITLDANDLVADGQSLWVSTISHGLLRFTTGSKRPRRFRFSIANSLQPDEQLLDVQQDEVHSDWLWIGSFQGLIGFNKRTGRYRRFTTRQGLPDNTVYSILPDRQGYLWLSTNRGLCRFHPRSQTTLSIGLSDGLPGEEFNRFHQLRLPDGRLAFGGVKGWVDFDPTQIKPDTARPQVVLTSLRINNQPVTQYGSQANIPQPLSILTQLVLRHDQNYLTVDFAALRYHQPDRVTYRYKLQGYDEDWTTSEQPSANYTKLPAGHYSFDVKAANAAGQWNRQVRQLALIIQPPVWASWWAYLFYALLLGSCSVALIRFRVKRQDERRELSQRQQQTEKLEQVAKDKARFFANVSHELRTPLTLMLGPLSTLLRRQQLTTQDEQLLRLADANARQLLRLVRDLLDLTKLEADQLVLKPQPVFLKGLLDETILPFQVQAQQTGITLTITLGAAPNLVVLLDAGKVKQILQNLLSNACKFTSAGGRITVRVRTEADRLQCWVEDTGRGIHPNDLPHIFERYFQTRLPYAPLEGGTGIGLALCQELVQLMSGKLTVTSNWGSGSSFLMELPLEIAFTEPPTEEPTIDVSSAVIASSNLPLPIETSGSFESAETVLVVEDNVDLKAYLTAMLASTYTIRTAANGQEALTVLAELGELPSLLIADIMMPVMDGFQLLETVKAHPVYRSIPVVMLTARTDMADKLRALRLGVDDYLLKPFDELELTARVSNLLRNQRERQKQADTHQVVPSDDSPTLPLADVRWLEQLEQLIQDRLGSFDLTADELADEISMSRRTFYRTIKRLTGLTPAQYLMEARFREARRLLETQSVVSVKQLAYQVGLRQVSHFAQLYQKRYGKSPSDYL
ncbi:ATP-binding protein [Spirosoma aerolatum]|uniref:ATP-binding protein n=1 Tax=Spirosoma aerolatum TaxID=1211326 RepID=UPI0009ABEA74|nr:ATP-binding protein [Spirosoma aerolatum]